MKNWDLILIAVAFFLFAGCASPPDNASDVAVRAGMSRAELKVMYGEPLRVEPNAVGGEDWYYHFYSRFKSPSAAVNVSSETDFSGSTVSSSSDSYQIGKDTDEEPIHLSPDGRVVGPLPSGNVLKN
jgi:hypothetical protein